MRVFREAVEFSWRRGWNVFLSLNLLLVFQCLFFTEGGEQRRDSHPAFQLSFLLLPLLSLLLFLPPSVPTTPYTAPPFLDLLSIYFSAGASYQVFPCLVAEVVVLQYLATREEDC